MCIVFYHIKPVYFMENKNCQFATDVTLNFVMDSHEIDIFKYPLL